MKHFKKHVNESVSPRKFPTQDDSKDICDNSKHVNEEKCEEVLREYSSGENTRRLPRRVELFTNILAFILVVFLIYTSIFGTLPTLQQRSFYLSMVLCLVFFVYPASKKKDQNIKWFDYLLGIIALCCNLYVFFNYKNILLKMGISDLVDQIIFVLLVITILEGTRRVVGKGLTFICIIFLMYAFFGDKIPGVFQIRTSGLSRMTDHMLMIPEGIYSTSLGAAATYVSVFVIFSSMLTLSGLGLLIQDLALGLAGKMTGGPAKCAVFASAAFGSISGEAAANVVATGSFTIPLMKKCGYPPEFAGATEAVASTGGQFVPPVMGAAAFIMAEYMGEPYSQVMLAALIPAFLYYLSAYLTVHYRSKKLKLNKMDNIKVPNWKQTLKERGHLLIPFVVVIYMIIRQYTLSYAALLGLFLVIVLGQARATTRRSWKELFLTLIDSGKSCIMFGVTCACVGLIVGVVTMTGFGTILGNNILAISQGNMLLALILVAILCIILGMGMPTVAVYIVTATIAAPMVVKMGLPTMVAHFFCFYFGVIACITPPVAVPSYAAASIAGANGGRTGWVAFKMAFPAFLVPFVFVYEPSMLLVGSNIFNSVWVTITCALGVFMFVLTNEGYFYMDITRWKRFLLFVGALSCIDPRMYTDIIGLAILIFVVVSERIKYSRTKSINELSRVFIEE